MRKRKQPRPTERPSESAPGGSSIGPGPAYPPGPSADAEPGVHFAPGGHPVDVVVDKSAGAIWLRFGRPVVDLALKPSDADLLGRLLTMAGRRLTPPKRDDQAQYFTGSCETRHVRDAELAGKEMAAAPNVSVEMGAYELMVLVSQLQLALRQPGNHGPAARLAEDMARLLQARLTAHCPALAELLEAGWDQPMGRWTIRDDQVEPKP